MTLKKTILTLSVGLFVAGCSSTQKNESAATSDQTARSFDRADRIGSRAE